MTAIRPGWPPLPAPVKLISHAMMYYGTESYPTSGACVLRVFEAEPSEDRTPQYIAIVRDLGGDHWSVTNGAELIWRELHDLLGPGLTQIEHHEHARDGGPGEHFDQYLPGHRVHHSWRPISDISPLAPDGPEVIAWWTRWHPLLVNACLESPTSEEW